MPTMSQEQMDLIQKERIEWIHRESDLEDLVETLTIKNTALKEALNRVRKERDG